MKKQSQSFWNNKKVFVTGGTGFIGSFVTEQLVKKGALVSVTTMSGNVENISSVKKEVKILKVDLRNPEEAIRVSKKHDIILHLASKVAGIQFNINHPATMFSDNILITKNI